MKSGARVCASKRTDEIQTRDNFLTLLPVGVRCESVRHRPVDAFVSVATHPSLIGNFASWIFIQLNGTKGVEERFRARDADNPFVFKLSARLIKASFFTSNLQ